MLPGPTKIKACSQCAKPVEEETIASGNTFGAVFWTDGKREAPMLPDQLWLAMCPHCGAALWLDDLDELGDRYPGEDTAGEFEGAKPCKPPAVDDFFGVLDQGPFAPDKQRFLRLGAWWAGNDSRRRADTDIPLSDREASNLTAFLDLLDEADDSDRLMKAEALRELGRFDEARSILAGTFDGGMARAVEIIRRLTEEQDSYVREISVE